MVLLLSLSLWFAVMMSSCYGDTGSHKEDTTNDYYDYETTPTPDYDYYNFTPDYYFVTGYYSSEVHNKAAGIGQVGPALLLGLAAHHLWC